MPWLGEPLDVVEAWVRRAEDVWYTPGEVVVTYGEPWQHWHVVVSGRLTILRAGVGGPQFGEVASGTVLGPRGLPAADASPHSDLHAVAETLVRVLAVPLPEETPPLC